ncbi:hypothetical protein [Effusibacillus consociatus]|uniref:PhzF family phenazine biosynthesis protein n=1 Tax=Effusibacillus consociatus TaxID=1117041 RepID=A0ABV9PWT2_9BACL
MPGLTFYIVFAEEKYAGNQLAVFTGAASLSDAEMQLNGSYDVRILKTIASICVSNKGMKSAENRYSTFERKTRGTKLMCLSAAA